MTRPWEINAGTLPWELPGPLFPRTITFKRPIPPANNGAVGYQGVTEAAETVLISGIIANVAIAASGRNTAGGELPADSPGPIKWTITLPPSVMPTLPLIQERDMAYDDLGRRFQVSAFEPSTLGAKIDTVRKLA